ncbi:MAG: membrane-bound dehydrogenase, partial [Planctomycetota bacterium]
DRCIDLLNEVPNNKPVCFRTPCCDSLNTLSPRFFTEIFAKTTAKGNFLQADSSVMQVFTSADPALPRELVLDADGKEKFKKYLPTDRFFANSIENYPYPFVVDRLCWEFPCVAPSDWAAQHFHKPNNPQTIEDWKAALDCTVVKQGVFCLVFHPHNWIKPEQINELIDHAVTKHGKKVKFLTFREAVERLNKNVLGGQSLRSDKGRDNGVRMLDVDNDGLLDATIGNSSVQQTRVWSNQESHWLTTDFPAVLTDADRSHLTRFGAMSGVRGAMLFQPVLEKIWNFEHGHWHVKHEKHSLGTKFAFANELLLPLDLSIRDVDHDGKPNLVVVQELGISVSGWSDKCWPSAGCQQR